MNQCPAGARLKRTTIVMVMNVQIRFPRANNTSTKLLSGLQRANGGIVKDAPNMSGKRPIDIISFEDGMIGQINTRSTSPVRHGNVSDVILFKNAVIDARDVTEMVLCICITRHIRIWAMSSRTTLSCSAMLVT